MTQRLRETRYRRTKEDSRTRCFLLPTSGGHLGNLRESREKTELIEQSGRSVGIEGILPTPKFHWS